MSIPTMKIFVKGEVVSSIVGAVSQEELEDEIKKVL
jgi:thioredoxin-like negative regulator of GroEL